MGAATSNCKTDVRCKECQSAAVCGDVPEWKQADAEVAMPVVSMAALRDDRIDAWTMQEGDLNAPAAYIADVHEGTEIVMKGHLATIEDESVIR